MLLAEDLLLLVTEDASGRLSAPAEQVDAGLGGANLVELTLLNKVDLSGEQDPGRRGRIIVRDPSPAGDAVLDAALEILVARQGKRPSAVIGPLSKNLRGTLYQRLADRGVVRAERGRIFGVFPVRRWPAQDASDEAEVRRLMTQALVEQVVPDTAAGAQIGVFWRAGARVRHRAGRVIACSPGLLSTARRVGPDQLHRSKARPASSGRGAFTWGRSDRTLSIACARSAAHAVCVVVPLSVPFAGGGRQSHMR